MDRTVAYRILSGIVFAGVLGGACPVAVRAQPDTGINGQGVPISQITEHRQTFQLAQALGEEENQPSSPSAGAHQQETAQAGEDVDYGESLDDALQKEQVRDENQARDLNFEKTKAENEFAKQEVICRSTNEESAVEQCRKAAHQDQQKKLADLEVKGIDERTEHMRRETMIRNHWAMQAHPAREN